MQKNYKYPNYSISFEYIEQLDRFEYSISEPNLQETCELIVGTGFIKEEDIEEIQYQLKNICDEFVEII